jgi:hypothetical protein
MSKNLEVQIPEEMYVSPGLPTLRPGFPALASVTLARGTSADRPYQWFVTDFRSKVLAAFALTSVLDPLADVGLPPVPPPGPPFDPNRLVAAGQDLGRLQRAFFEGQPLSEEARAASRDTVAFLVAAQALPWLLTYCADFFEWIDWPEPP